jgi:superfamily II DNA or RNA helicase
VACPGLAVTGAAGNPGAITKCDHCRTGGPDLPPAFRVATLVDRASYSPCRVPKSRILRRASHASIDPRQASDHLLRGADQPSHCATSRVPRDAIGMVGGGRRKPKGLIDVALIQSLVRKGEVDDIVGNYGHLVVDECHHLSAVSFELAARRSKARYIPGLSATVTRKDGHHPIIVMQCGPVRHRVDARTEAAKRPFDHVVRIRDTSFQLQATLGTAAPAIQDVLKELVDDEARNDLIFDDVLCALEAGRSPVVITERTAHLETIAKRLERFARHLVVLRGGRSEKQRRDIATRLAAIPPAEERVIVATGRYLGEGFDDSRLDTLFLPCQLLGKAPSLSMPAGYIASTTPSAR